MSESAATMRWDPYSLTSEAEFDGFWRRHLDDRPRRLLLLLGKGFDVRALETARRLHALGADIHVWLLAFHNGQQDTKVRRERTDRNVEGLGKLFDQSRILEVDIDLGGPFDEPLASRETHARLRAAGDPTLFDDVVVDISAMPRMVAMTSVAVLLYRLDKAREEEGRCINLHVATAESVSADNDIGQGSLRDQVSSVRGFRGQLTAQTTKDLPHVWFPVLGENQVERLDKIHQYLNPDEICPVVPFPSREPRRGDEIIYAHREILFDTFQVEPRNILLACEYNPFEAYKQLFEAMDRYRLALNELGGCKAFVSPLSSKLLSIAVLLACYDHLYGQVPGKRLTVGIPYVETAAYADPKQKEGDAFELYTMWICGEWEVLAPTVQLPEDSGRPIRITGMSSYGRRRTVPNPTCPRAKLRRMHNECRVGGFWGSREVFTDAATVLAGSKAGVVLSDVKLYKLMREQGEVTRILDPNGPGGG